MPAIPPNFPSIKFDAPDKICERCGRVIPTNGWQTNEKGEVLTDERGRAIGHANARLVCDCYAQIEVPQPPPKPRRKKGVKTIIPGQAMLPLEKGERIK